MFQEGDIVYCGTGDKPGTFRRYQEGFAKVWRSDLNQEITMPLEHLHREPYKNPKNDPRNWTPDE